MLQSVATLPPPRIVELGAGTPGTDQVQADLENMLAALIRHHGHDRALVMLGEGFAGAFAMAAQRSGSSVAWRYAIEVALRNAFERAQWAPINPPPDLPGAA